MAITFKDFLDGKVGLGESKLFKGDKEIRTFDFNKKNMTEEEQLAFIEKKLKEYSKEAETANNQFTSIFKKYATRYNAKFVHGGIKSLKSIMSKVVARNKPLSGIGDLIRGAMLFKNEKELNEFIEDLKRHGKVKILDIDVKKKGDDKVYGYYGGVHLDIEINDITIELQAMTERLWKYKFVAHDVYDKVRDGLKVTDDVLQYSRDLFKLGNKPKFVRESLDEETDGYDGWVILVDNE